MSNLLEACRAASSGCKDRYRLSDADVRARNMRVRKINGLLRRVKCILFHEARQYAQSLEPSLQKTFNAFVARTLYWRLELAFVNGLFRAYWGESHDMVLTLETIERNKERIAVEKNATQFLRAQGFRAYLHWRRKDLLVIETGPIQTRETTSISIKW